MKTECFFENPLIDKKIDGKSWMTTITIGNYLELVSLKDNPFQRNILSSTFYKKLIDDLLHDTTMPPISIVWMGNNFDLNDFNESRGKCLIIDGLQRTNCLLQCKALLDKGGVSTCFENTQEFLNKHIYVEIWEKLDLKKMLYKMVVLNTGQKKMDYSHQLDILNDSVQEKLKEYGITYVTTKQKIEEKIPAKSEIMLSTITESLVSYINKYPISGKKSAADFLFENFNIGLESNSDNAVLSVIDDDKTYDNLKWTLCTFDSLLEEKYLDENPFKKYDVFLIGFFASVGFAHQKNAENLQKNIERLEELMRSDKKDPISLNEFKSYSGSFKSGIGEKRRKLVFETFKNFFLSKPENNDEIEWGETYERFF